MGRKSEAQKKKEKQAEATSKWKKENMIGVSFRLSKAHESDIIEKLDSVPSKKTYIVNLIRADMRRDK